MSPLLSQLVLLPLLLIVVVGFSVLAITDLELVIRRRLRVDEFGGDVVELPRRRPQVEALARELERELFDRASGAEAGER